MDSRVGEILTLDNLRKEDIIVTEWCCMRKRSGESIDHLLLDCEVASKVWNMVCQLFGVTWVMPGGLIECLGGWRGQKGNQIVLQSWKMAPFVCYVVLMERKECTEF